VLGIISLIFSLALSTYAIYTKHKGTESARLKILKDVGVMVFTLVAVIFLGGIAATLANYQASIRWGEVAGLVSALVASFAVGYLVRVGMVKLSG
jgi:fructose-specific phosphotransferase system IIC component